MEAVALLNVCLISGAPRYHSDASLAGSGPAGGMMPEPEASSVYPSDPACSPVRVFGSPRFIVIGQRSTSG
jgi:hypothetical protein